ncbi:hypothetical protein OPV22_005560 [Ensete ventricosum]|uniref:Uncharacterized protein n=1 Tax=Ensete ventricosum TaxID=4639 RepID=A0AAV8RMU5_ENSVE|nr:hypothetical protein OPV22_005560 [Ensete ventricosum]
MIFGDEAAVVPPVALVDQRSWKERHWKTREPNILRWWTVLHLSQGNAHGLHGAVVPAPATFFLVSTAWPATFTISRFDVSQPFLFFYDCKKISLMEVAKIVLGDMASCHWQDAGGNHA